MISSGGPDTIAQDVIRCSLCVNAVAMHCRSCNVNLCEQCISQHVQKSSTLKNHDLLPYTKRAASSELVEGVVKNCKDHPKQICMSARVLLEKEELLATFKVNNIKLKGICCDSKDKVWIYGDDEKMRQFDKLGNLLNCITAISGFSQKDIAVNKNGDVAFSHMRDECVKILREKYIQKLVDITGWIPYGLCFNSDDELMVCMRRNDYSESRVGIYLGERLKQEIQYDDTNKSLFSTGRNNMYITENGNRDICVSDWNASAVIVTKKSGEFRFRYTGGLSRSYKEFYPHGIDTDNYCRIFVVDRNNDSVHVIDRNGKFLRYINCSLKDPYVLSIDSNENLWVGECDEQNIKVIKYLD